MDFLEKCRTMLKLDEGARDFPYDDRTGRRVTADIGNVTIGVGRNLDINPLSRAAIDFLLNEDIDTAMDAAFTVFIDFEHYEPNRQLAIINMIFNMGIGRFRQFTKLIQAVKNKDWAQAAYEAAHSYWYSQVGDRAKRVVSMLLNNEYPYGD